MKKERNPSLKILQRIERKLINAVTHSLQKFKTVLTSVSQEIALYLVILNSARKLTFKHFLEVD